LVQPVSPIARSPLPIVSASGRSPGSRSYVSLLACFPHEVLGSVVYSLIAGEGVSRKSILRATIAAGFRRSPAVSGAHVGSGL